jgi:cadmium resistance protein CadD (predicted permease)
MSKLETEMGSYNTNVSLGKNEALIYTSLIFGIIEITAGILMFINKTMFWGTISYMIGIFFQCLILLSTLTDMAWNTPNVEKIKKMYEKGIFMFVYILLILGVYVACIANSLDNIAEDVMPPQWTWYSRIIGVILCVIITPILNIQIDSILKSNADTKKNQQRGIIAGHFLFIFVYIQYIISFYYQTDGFTV